MNKAVVQMTCHIMHGLFRFQPNVGGHQYLQYLQVINIKLYHKL